MGTIDAQGNIHDRNGLFAEKQNSAPGGSLSAPAYAVVPASERPLEEIGLGEQGERFVMAAALTGEPYVIFTDAEHHDQAVAAAFAAARLRGVHVEAPDRSTPVTQMVASGRSPVWEARPTRDAEGMSVQELGVGDARIEWAGEGGSVRAVGRHGEDLGSFPNAGEAQRAVSSSLIEPGAIPRADGGVLLLDNAPDFSPFALDVLREPMQSGSLTVHRGSVVKRFDARVQVALISETCPCGLSGDECDCSALDKRRYQAKLSGPLRDRVAATFNTGRVQPGQEFTGRTEEAAASQIADARRRESASPALRRATGLDAPTVAAAAPFRLREATRGATPEGARMLDSALERGQITLRRYDKANSRAWSLAFLDGEDQPSAEHAREALESVR